MRSSKIKLLHEVAGRPMVSRLVEAVAAISPRSIIAVVGFQGEPVRKALAPFAPVFVEQREQRGTGHAVLQAAAAVRRVGGGPLLVLNGDLPALRPATLRRLLALHRRRGASLSLVTTTLPDPDGYGRIVRDERGGVVRIAEDRDCSPVERAIHEVNCGIYCADAATLFGTLRGLKPNNTQKEIYLTDAVARLIARGAKVAALLHEDAAEVLGVNTREELSRVTRAMWARKAAELQASGVTIVDPALTSIDPEAKIGRDTVLWPGVTIQGATRLGEGCQVLPGSRIADCRIGRRVEIRDHSVLVDSRVGDDVTIGPFAHLRPGSIVEDQARIGNYVELKKTRLGRRSKAPHLSYLGDAEIGADCNIGAGTITCNYDGQHKHPTTIGRAVFIGSDSQLIAPVTIADRAYVAAGSTITEDVPAGALAIARGRQRNVEGWVAKRQPKKRAKRR